jgi:hypothetical protein
MGTVSDAAGRRGLRVVVDSHDRGDWASLALNASIGGRTCDVMGLRELVVQVGVSVAEVGNGKPD